MFAAYRSSAALLICLALAACGRSDERAKEPVTVKNTALEDMVGTMDEARGVEHATMQHKQDLDRAMNDAEGDR